MSRQTEAAQRKLFVPLGGHVTLCTCGARVVRDVRESLDELQEVIAYRNGAEPGAVFL